ncbi:MAG: L,D-transpeptidase [Bacteroidia bacterium]|nr:L,D-transpeptidase [Bacteroidia bacterium]
MGNDEIINESSQPEVEKGIGEPNISKNEAIIQITNSLRQRFRANEKLFRFLRNLLIIIIPILVTLSLIIFILYLVPVLKELTSGQKTEITNNQELKKDTGYKKQISLMTRDIQRLSRKYNAYSSGQSYIVINTTDNRFFLYRNKKLIREGFCSSGSYTMLQTEGDKPWIFKTPKGKYWIQGKTTNPVWKRPDWSFVEEGLPIPPKDDFSRYEYGVLGDYALAIGDGYLIHGTIYKRFLGMPVTHGCVRLNDEDLKVIFNTLSIGSKVYIF